MCLPRNSPDRPHPCLINAIYLIASHFSRAAFLSKYDRTFLSRARAGIAAAVKARDRLQNAIQASCLVSFYLYFKSRVLEGYWISGTTCRLAIACGLHQINGVLSPTSTSATPPAVDPLKGDASSRPLVLPEIKTSLELGERIHTFWQVLNISVSTSWCPWDHLTSIGMVYGQVWCFIDGLCTQFLRS
jgi:Fungal specific transcription factor domain